MVTSIPNCPCGRKHETTVKELVTGKGALSRLPELVARYGAQKPFILADTHTYAVCGESVRAMFPNAVVHIYDSEHLPPDNNTVGSAFMHFDRTCDLVIAIGSGVINDTCKIVSHVAKLPYIIVATAPSMDGFASDTAPIIVNNFKNSWKAAQPMVIIADTKILAKAPVELKAAGFGDMIAKYIGIFDWKVANLLIDEYYCPEVAELTMKGVRKIVALADKVTLEDEETAGAIMEALVMSGLGMKLALSSRPASGAEHVLSHYWECYKLARGIWPEFHGKKVGVASVLINRIYHNIVDRVEDIDPIPDPTDWDKVRAAFSPEQLPELEKINTPTITDKVDPARLKAIWPEVRRLANEILPSDAEMMRLMKLAGAVTKPADVHVSPELLETGLRYHSYMRYRILLTRLLPMMQLDIMDFVK